MKLHSRTAARFYEDMGLVRWADPLAQIELHLRR